MVTIFISFAKEWVYPRVCRAGSRTWHGSLIIFGK